MTDRPTPRQVARQETIDRIKELALDQLAESAATDLSLRAIARDLNIVSSGIYRYFGSRDELITALIVDAYNDLAGHLEAASSQAHSPRTRWVGGCTGMRDWALATPHRFALIYGSAIPGYRAPEATIPAAARVVATFLAPLATPDLTPRDAQPPAKSVIRPLETLQEGLGLDIDRQILLLGVRAFSQLLGLLTLELNGHLVGTFEPADDLFADFVAREAHAIGL